MNNSKAYTEVNEVLKHISIEEYDKIPQEILDTIHNNKDENYIWKYDFNKSLVEQDLCKEASDLLSYIFMNYLFDIRDKEQIEIEFKKKNNILYDINTQNVLSYNEMFAKNKPILEKENVGEILPEKKEKSFFKKLKRIISSLFKK